MLEYLTINGEQRLEGEVRISGAKNSALPLLVATLLTKERCVLRNVPDLEDINVLLRLLNSFGANYSFLDNAVVIETPEIVASEAPYWLVKALRASFWVLGPLLARTGAAQVALPGGDAIGTRPVDLHLKGLVKMGADIRMRHGVISATAPGKLCPQTIDLDYPSVGATHNLLMTAALVPGETIIKNAAREHEVVELAETLAMMGAEVEGAGESTIKVVGQSELGGVEQTVLGDRIEAATFLVAAAMTAGKVKVSGLGSEIIAPVLDILSEAGCAVVCGDREISLKAPERLKGVSFDTAPHPGVPTDAQPLLMAAMSKAEGKSLIRETVFDNRFGHVAEYLRFGADISLEGISAEVNGVARLSGAPVEALDIRAAAGLLLMGLAAEGETQITELHHFDRGYDRLVEKFSSLGASLQRVPVFEQKELIVGC